MEDCLFCKIIKGEIPCYKVYEDDVVLAFLDVHPMGQGHTLVIPKTHYKDITDIDLEVLSHINEVTKKIYDLIQTKLKPIGIKIIQNNGACQEIKHYHTHIVPVYKKDNKEDLEQTLKTLLN